MVLTFKEKFNRKYKFPKGKSHSLSEISKLTGFQLSGLQTIFNKGVGAFYTNPESVRPHIRSPEEWAYARVYSAVMGGPTAKIDKSHLIKK
jgi:hypothetical protein